MEKKHKIILATVGLTTIGFGAGVGGLVHYANNKDLGIETKYFSTVESFIRVNKNIYTDTYLEYCVDPCYSRHSICKFIHYNPETQSFTSDHNVSLDKLDIHYVEDKTWPIYDQYTGLIKGYAKQDYHVLYSNSYRFGKDPIFNRFKNSSKNYLGRGILTTHTQLVRGWTTNYYTLTLEYYKTSSDSLYAVKQWSFDGDGYSSFMTFRSDDMSIKLVAEL